MHAVSCHTWSDIQSSRTEQQCAPSFEIWIVKFAWVIVQRLPHIQRMGHIYVNKLFDMYIDICIFTIHSMCAHNTIHTHIFYMRNVSLYIRHTAKYPPPLSPLPLLLLLVQLLLPLLLYTLCLNVVEWQIAAKMQNNLWAFEYILSHSCITNMNFHILWWILFASSFSYIPMNVAISIENFN